MRYLLVLVLFAAGCSGGPVMKQDCDAVGNHDQEYVCKGDKTSHGCVYESQKQVWICDK